MNVAEMLSIARTSLEDLGEDSFSPSVLLSWLNDGQLDLARKLHPNFLYPLNVHETGVVPTAGVTAFTDLTETVFKGDEGILDVFVTSGVDFKEVQYKDVARLQQNTMFAPSVRNPLYAVFGGNIYTYPTSIASIVVRYIKKPDTIVFAFEGDTDPAAADEIVGDDNQGLSAVDDYYNGSVIYIVEDDDYYCVDDYTGSTRILALHKVSPLGVGSAVTWYWVTSPFKAENLAGITSELPEEVHATLVDYVIMMGYATARDIQRMDSYLGKYNDSINMLNAQYQTVRGVGTKSLTQPDGR